MDKNSAQKIFLPQCDGISLDFIKLTAALCMVVDHVNAIWWGKENLLMLLIGRVTFPLFCYAVAEAVLRIKERAHMRRYLMRMLVLALVTQPIYFFALGGATVNVIFTLFLGIVFAAMALRARPQAMYALFAAALASMLWTLPLEFGWAGVMAPAAMVMTRRGDKTAFGFLLALLFFMNAGGLLGAADLRLPGLALGVDVLKGLVCVLSLPLTLDVARGLRQTGRLLPKYALHVFYPGHLLALKLAQMVFFP